MVPERVCEFDPKCIADAESYIGLLQQFSNSTLGELSLGSLRAQGSIGENIKIEFEYVGKTHAFKFKQAGRWVEDEFYIQLRKFCKRHLTGGFLSIDNELSTDVYLPHKALAQIEKKTRKIKNTNELVQALLGRLSHSELIRIRESTRPEILYGHTSEGETIITALAKSDVSMETFMDVFFCVGGFSQIRANRFGETPQELALNLKGITDPSVTEIYPSKMLGFTELKAQKGGGLWIKNTAGYMRILSPLDVYLDEMLFDRLYNMTEITMSHSQAATDQAYVKFYEDRNVYELFVQTLGEGGGSLYQELPAEQADVVVDILRRYCTKSLWGADNGWSWAS